MVAISPDRPEQMITSLEVEDLGYALYSDSALNAAREFGIAFQLGSIMVTGMKMYGINLEEASGKDHHQLPVPSVFLVDKRGTIRWVYSNSDYKIRPDNAVLLDAARRVSAEFSTEPAPPVDIAATPCA